MGVTYARYVVGVAYVLGQQSVADLPREDGRALALVLADATDHVGGRYTRLTAADRPRTNGPALIVATEDLAHAPVRYLHQSQNKNNKSHRKSRLYATRSFIHQLKTYSTCSNFTYATPFSQKIYPFLWGSGPVLWARPTHHPKRHLDQVSRFFQNSRSLPTERPTVRTGKSDCTNSRSAS